MLVLQLVLLAMAFVSETLVTLVSLKPMWLTQERFHQKVLTVLFLVCELLTTLASRERLITQVPSKVLKTVCTLATLITRTLLLTTAERSALTAVR